jgi:hypothetical protein
MRLLRGQLDPATCATVLSFWHSTISPPRTLGVTDNQEWRDLNAQWSKAHKEAEKLVVLSSETAKQKVIKLRLSVDLRRQIRDRFYPRGGDIQDYIKWIAKLESDVRQLADSLLSMYVHL